MTKNSCLIAILPYKLFVQKSFLTMTKRKSRPHKLTYKECKRLACIYCVLNGTPLWRAKKPFTVFSIKWFLTCRTNDYGYKANSCIKPPIFLEVHVWRHLERTDMWFVQMFQTSAHTIITNSLNMIRGTRILQYCWYKMYKNKP